MRLYPIAFLAVLAACFGAQTLALRMAGGRTVKSESNYFSSIARLQTGNREDARILMLGSSMTARLADRTKPIPGIVNLGCDGGSAVITLRAIDRGDLKAAPLVIVEANMLAFELEHRGKEIAESIGSDWFKLGTRIPNLSATARPTAFAYSKLLARNNTTASGSLPIDTKPHRLESAPVPELDPAASALVDELAGILKRLEERGSKVILLVLPPGIEPGTVQGDLPAVLAKRSGVLWWDLTEGLPKDAVGFTDGLHLDTESAGKVLSHVLYGVEGM
ncbi:hypothetical protein [Haloferula sp. BvORR071]|uniref:hypothetical protein n=1 Tax=Haloferula sp. BvORR071 TaxID=1396141 RepID=UPI00054E6A86|nr:hypothetical protein [Haloferula sp. BvORR071]